MSLQIWLAIRSCFLLVLNRSTYNIVKLNVHFFLMVKSVGGRAKGIYRIHVPFARLSLSVYVNVVFVVIIYYIHLNIHANDEQIQIYAVVRSTNSISVCALCVFSSSFFLLCKFFVVVVGYLNLDLILAYKCVRERVYLCPLQL